MAHPALIIGQNGGALQQIGVHENAVRFLFSWRNQTWLSFNDAVSAVFMHKGGRQGCRFGREMFNIVDSDALNVFMHILRHKGLNGSVHFQKGSAPWINQMVRPLG